MNLILILLKFYKKVLSMVFEGVLGHACRFTPSCSEYSLEAFEKLGFWKGLRLTFLRLARCHPLSKTPYFDPVPEYDEFSISSD